MEPNSIEPNTIEPNTIEPNAIEPNAIEPNSIEPIPFPLSNSICKFTSGLCFTRFQPALKSSSSFGSSFYDWLHTGSLLTEPSILIEESSSSLLHPIASRYDYCTI